jgi:hypothetical protein
MRLTRDSETDEVRDALIEQDMESLTTEEIGEIAITRWPQFEPLIRRYVEEQWSDGREVWLEAEDRGFFEYGNY